MPSDSLTTTTPACTLPYVPRHDLATAAPPATSQPRIIHLFWQAYKNYKPGPGADAVHGDLWGRHRPVVACRLSSRLASKFIDSMARWTGPSSLLRRRGAWMTAPQAPQTSALQALHLAFQQTAQPGARAVATTSALPRRRAGLGIPASYAATLPLPRCGSVCHAPLVVIILPTAAALPAESPDAAFGPTCAQVLRAKASLRPLSGLRKRPFFWAFRSAACEVPRRHGCIRGLGCSGSAVSGSNEGPAQNATKDRGSRLPGRLMCPTDVP